MPCYLPIMGWVEATEGTKPHDLGKKLGEKRIPEPETFRKTWT